MIRILCTLIFPLAFFTTGCAEHLAVTQTVAQPQEAHKLQTQLAVSVERCIDRTGAGSSRDLASEATQALIKRLRESDYIEIRDGAALLITCDVERFEEGSAFQRWLWPTLGPTIGAAAVTVWDVASQRVMLTLRSQSSVRGGGLYTIGADKAIFRAVFDDLIKKLEKWALGEKVSGDEQ